MSKRDDKRQEATIDIIVHSNVEATIYRIPQNPHPAGAPCPACEARIRYADIATTHPVASVRQEARVRLLARKTVRA